VRSCGPWRVTIATSLHERRVTDRTQRLSAIYTFGTNVICLESATHHMRSGRIEHNHTSNGIYTYDKEVMTKLCDHLCV
jgi:hypothetical protein